MHQYRRNGIIGKEDTIGESFHSNTPADFWNGLLFFWFFALALPVLWATTIKTTQHRNYVIRFFFSIAVSNRKGREERAARWYQFFTLLFRCGYYYYYVTFTFFWVDKIKWRDGTPHAYEREIIVRHRLGSIARIVLAWGLFPMPAGTQIRLFAVVSGHKSDHNTVEIHLVCAAVQ